MAFKVGSTTVIDSNADVVAERVDIDDATAETSFAFMKQKRKCFKGLANGFQGRINDGY